jgi:hypothetical protein
LEDGFTPFLAVLSNTARKTSICPRLSLARQKKKEFTPVLFAAGAPNLGAPVMPKYH